MRTRPALEVGAPELFVWVGLSKICHKKFVEAIDLHLGSGGGGRGEIIRSHDGGRSSDGAVLRVDIAYVLLLHCCSAYYGQKTIHGFST